MFLEIVSPEATLFSHEINAVSAPGIEGEFQILNNHAPIVSILGAGKIKIEGNGFEIAEAFKSDFVTEGNKQVLSINGGTLEMKENKIIVLID